MRKGKEFLLKQKASSESSKPKQIIKFWQIISSCLGGLIFYRYATSLALIAPLIHRHCLNYDSNVMGDFYKYIQV